MKFHEFERNKPNNKNFEIENECFYYNQLGVLHISVMKGTSFMEYFT